MRALALGLVILVAACSVDSVSPEQRVLIACEAYAGTLEALTVRNQLGLLSDAAEARVDSAVDIIAPICESAAPANASSVLTTLETALIIMIEEQNRVD